MSIVEKKKPVLLLFLAASFAAAIMTHSAVAQAAAQSSSPQPSAAPAYTPESPKVAAGAVDVTQLLQLMDTDKNGKISRKEFMDFMAAEFDRLDTDKSGELDPKELAQSQLTTTRHGGTRR
jgi:EF hand domain-containing protein